MTAMSRGLMSITATAILVTPIIVLSFISNAAVRLVITVIAAGVFAFAVTFLAKTRTIEVLAGGAA